MTPPRSRVPLEQLLRLPARDLTRGGRWWTYTDGTRLASVPTPAGVVVAPANPDGTLPAVGQLLRVVDRPANRGGPSARQWFLVCPRCAARRRDLYAAPGGIAYGWRCRECWRGSYASTREGAEWRAFRRVQRVAARLGVRDLVPVDSFELAQYGAPEKPHRMRWATFDRLDAALREVAAVHAWRMNGTLAALVERVGAFSDRPAAGEVTTQ